MSFKRVGLIGFGSIGRNIVDSWLRQPPAGYRLEAVLVRDYQLDDALALVSHGIRFTDRYEDFCAIAMDLVVEAAGQSAVVNYAEHALSCGRDFYALSSGALVDQALLDRLTAVACANASRLLVPVGAIAGIDGIMVLRRGGLRQVTYTSRKPPRAWKGTQAEQRFVLEDIREATTLFSGSAYEAALAFPKNANLAATVALAGLGVHATRVELVADPNIDSNVGSIEAIGEDGILKVSMDGRASRANPKSSAITGLSVMALLDNAGATLAFG
jgi:aspartate dehydrogenase